MYTHMYIHTIHIYAYMRTGPRGRCRRPAAWPGRAPARTNKIQYSISKHTKQNKHVTNYIYIYLYIHIYIYIYIHIHNRWEHV